MKVYYRGSKKGDKRRIRTGVDVWDNNLFCSKEEKNAKLYGPDIEIIITKPYAKIITEGTNEFMKEFGERNESQTLLDWGVTVVAKAKALEYHVVEFKRQGETGTVIIDKRVVIRNAINEKDIKSYMEQFAVGRETAIKEIAQIVLNKYIQDEKETEETYESIIRLGR